MKSSHPNSGLPAWRESITGETEKVTRGHSTVGFWDNMSHIYDRNHDEKARQMLAETLDDLERRDYFAPGMRVLDIGCGTGRMAITMAKRGADVTAFDFTVGMLDKLRANMRGLSGYPITVVQGDWTDINIDECGWNGAFDLVLANMTPAIRSPEGLEKLITASRNNCYLKTWAEKRRSALLDDIWLMITGTEPTHRRAPLIYMFNAIYAMGFYPVLDYERVAWTSELTFDEALEQYVAYAHGMFGSDEAELRKSIASYLEPITVNGIITENITGMTGRMLWKIT